MVLVVMDRECFGVNARIFVNSGVEMHIDSDCHVGLIINNDCFS